RWIIRLQIACGRKFCERVARPPERFSCLFRAQLAAVPDHHRFGAACRRLRGEALDGRPGLTRQSPLRTRLWPDRVTVMNQKESHRAPTISSVKNTEGIRGHR